MNHMPRRQKNIVRIRGGRGDSFTLLFGKDPSSQAVVDALLASSPGEWGAATVSAAGVHRVDEHQVGVHRVDEREAQ